VRARRRSREQGLEEQGEERRRETTCGRAQSGERAKKRASEDPRECQQTGKGGTEHVNKLQEAGSNKEVFIPTV
jgi:hypothetical protein